MKKWEVICGLVFPWILIFFGIPVGTYYITNLPVRGIYIGVIVFSAGILFRLALDIWQDKRNNKGRTYRISIRSCPYCVRLSVGYWL